MKALKLKMLSLFFLVSGGIAVMGQQSRSEVPGDYFSLEGALELFKKSDSPEEFERLLNSSNSKVNNLDLNGDGEIDYIRVIDRNEGNIHTFILQAVISDRESQDVAVIALEKLANGKAVLQITGDEDVYGIETIIEPTQEVRVNAGTTTQRNVVNVWTWPSVQYVYSPYYTVWSSPWGWHMRPIWWSSWRPIAYYDYYSYWQPYRPYYTRCHSHRVVYAQQIYRPYRTSSPMVYKRHHTQIAHYRSTYRDDDRNRKSNYDNDRSGRRYDEGKTGRDGISANRTPAVRERTSSELGNSRSVEIPRNQKEREPNVDRRSTGKHDETSYTSRNEVRTKPTVSERNSQPRHERSATVNTNKNSQPREVRSVERTERSKSTGHGEEKRGSRGGGKN